MEVEGMDSLAQGQEAAFSRFSRGGYRRGIGYPKR